MMILLHLKKTVIKSILLSVLIFIPFIAQAVEIDIDEAIREKYPLISRQMCHSSLDYPLEMPFEKDGLDVSVGAGEQYNKRMECLFESAFVNATDQMNSDFNTRFFNKIFNPTNVKGFSWKTKDREIKNKNCTKSDDINSIFKVQQNNGYKTLCKIDDRNSVVERPYSACRVSEVAWNEYCAYQEYLRWKRKDASVYLEFKKRTGYNDQARWNEYREIELKKYSREVSVSYRILSETLQQYETFERDYRIHLWQKVIAKSLVIMRGQLKLAAEAISHWPEKFINSTSR